MAKISTAWIVAGAAVQSRCSAPPEGGQVQDGGAEGLPWTWMLGNQRTAPLCRTAAQPPNFCAIQWSKLLVTSISIFPAGFGHRHKSSVEFTSDPALSSE